MYGKSHHIGIRDREEKGSALSQAAAAPDCSSGYGIKKIFPQAVAVVSNAVYRDKDGIKGGGGDRSYVCASSWTYQGIKGITRSFMYFHTDSIPRRIIKAAICLFGAGHDPLTQSNACYVMRVLGGWDEKSVTWDAQPGVHPFGKIKIAESSFADQDYVVDITHWARRWKTRFPWYRLHNYGIMIKLQNEECYTKMRFGACDHLDENKRPYLLVHYRSSPAD